MRRICATLILSGVLLVVSGCGGNSRPKLLPVTGVVNFEKQPLKNASVVFSPEGGLVAIGRTDDAGRFKLNTSGTTGVGPGSYKVAITAIAEQPQMSGEEAERMTPQQRQALSKSLIPVRYANPMTSNLTAAVASGNANSFTFDLTK
ncbi:MAG: carboxypeptidase-like regulatory domain-containing protein [Planctomycetota bacterium]